MSNILIIFERVCLYFFFEFYHFLSNVVTTLPIIYRKFCHRIMPTVDYMKTYILGTLKIVILLSFEFMLNISVKTLSLVMGHRQCFLNNQPLLMVWFKKRNTAV